MTAKPKSASPTGSSSIPVLNTLSWVRSQGFKPVPLKPGLKAAATPNYTNPDYEPPTDDYWRTRDLGIGVLLGPAAHGPVDIDLDCNEAIDLAPLFFPPTHAVFGRPGKPRSHMLYRVQDDEAPKRAYLDPILKKTILEVRGDGGHQTVFPGSLHEGTGELIAWSDRAHPGEVPTVDFTDLDAAAKRVAAAVLLARHVWVEGQRNEVCKHLAGMLYWWGWSLSDAEAFYYAVMKITDDDDRTRIMTLRSTYKKGEAGGKVSGGPSLKKLLGEANSVVVDRLNEWFGSPTQTVIEEYNARFGVVSLTGKFRVSELTTDNLGYSRYTFMTQDDFKALTAHETVEGEKGPIPKALIWLKDARRRQYAGVCFRPGVEDTGNLLNLWTGWAVEPNPDADCTAWYELLHEVICGGDDEATHWMLSWFANMLQDPLLKSLTAPVIIGRQGVGKTLMVTYFGKVLGPCFLAVTQDEHIHGKFNSHLATTLLLHSEEALHAGDRKHRSIIKSLITDSTRMMEPKGIDATQVENWMRISFTSNEMWAVGAEYDDRRFSIIDMGDRAASPELIERVVAEMEGDGPAGLLAYLLSYQYDLLTVRRNLKTEALLEMKKLNLDPVPEWWFGVLTEGQILNDSQSWAQDPHDAPWPAVLSSTLLYQRCVDDLRARSVRRIPSQTAFALEMNRLTGVLLQRKQVWFNNTSSEQDAARLTNQRQSAIYNMPLLVECRAAFERHLRQPIEWPEVDETTRPAHDQY